MAAQKCCMVQMQHSWIEQKVNVKQSNANVNTQINTYGSTYMRIMYV